MVRKKILILNGPNLNLLGTRDPEIYGHQTFEQFLDILREKFEKQLDIEYFQSNEEGAIIKTKGGNTHKITAQGWNAFRK